MNSKRLLLLPVIYVALIGLAGWGLVLYAMQAEVLFSEAHALHTARRFEENAYVLWKSGREDEAADCLAAASALRDDAAAEGPIARVMTRLCYNPLLEQLKARYQEAGDSDSGSES